MTEPLRMQDDSIEAMRERSEQSVVWSPGEVPERVGDFLWRAVRDRRLLLADAAPSPALTREALAAALPHRRSDLARRWVNLDASNGEFATFVLAALGGEPQDG